MSKRMLSAFSFACLALFTSAANAAGNYEYGIVMTRPVPVELRPSMSLEEIVSLRTVNDEVRVAITNTLKDSQSDLLRLALIDPSAMSANQRNVSLLGELRKTLGAVNMRLLANLKNVSVPDDLEFQIHVAPLLSKVLIARRAGDQVTPKSLYPSDRISVYETMSGDPIDGTTLIARDIYQGIAARLVEMYNKNTKQPFFGAMVLTLRLKKKVELSEMIAQVVMGVPVNTSMPFTEKNDQIVFRSVDMPKFDPRTLGITAEDMPAAMVTVEQTLAHPLAGKVLVELGPIGRFENGRWSRTGNGGSNYNMAPKLVGSPTMAVVNRLLTAEISILNIVADLESKGVADIDVFISAGPTAAPGVRAGWINKADIDDQFRTEINKTIAVTIAEQEKKAKESIEGVRKMLPPGIDQVLKTLFTVNPTN